MTADWVPAQRPHDMEGRRTFDTALGILIGIRRALSTQRFMSCSRPRNATDSRRSLWRGHSSISPVAAQNQLKHSAPRNRLHVANGVSSSRRLSRRPVDGR
jgi:hypothetical protein